MNEENIKLDRFDDKILKTLKENGILDLSSLLVKAYTRENRSVSIKRLRRLEGMGLIDFDDTNLRRCGYKIKLRDKNGRS